MVGSDPRGVLLGHRSQRHDPRSNSDEWLAQARIGRPRPLGRRPHLGDDGAELPPGEIGAVYFERDTLPFEYHNDPEKTRDACTQHPGWTTTGDVGYLDEDGYLYLTDRQSFMIISGGVNIYPQEIEDTLTEHPAVLRRGGDRDARRGDG